MMTDALKKAKAAEQQEWRRRYLQRLAAATGWSVGQQHLHEAGMLVRLTERAKEGSK